MDFEQWIVTPIGKYAKAYVPKYKIFPLHGIRDDLTCTCGKPDCTSPGKHPFTRNGLKDYSSNINTVAEMFQYRADLNIGIATGDISDFFVIDVDPRNGGDKSIIKLQEDFGALPPAPTAITGNGFHILFQYPGFKVTSRALNKELYPGIDIKGDGGYIVGAPSRHASGKYYEYIKDAPSKKPDAPAWLLELMQARKETAVNIYIDDKDVSGAIQKWSIEEVNRMLDVISPSLGYQDWISIGMGINDGGYPYEMWHNWSKSGANYTPNCCAPHWKTFKPNGGISMGTLVQMAQVNGWKPMPIEREPVDTSVVDLLVKKAEKLLNPILPEKPAPPELVKPRKVSAVGFDPMGLPGLIGDTVRWITKYAMKKQPELALINTLAFAGSVFGRRYASPLNTRTNIYLVGIATTGAGKEHSRKMIREIADAAGLNERIGADAIRSDTGLLRGLMNNSSQLLMIDEFGIFLQGLAHEKAPHYIKAQAQILLKLYSASNSVYNHGDYADAKAEAIIIRSPNLCIYGTSTEENYAKSLKKSAIESGELNRFITIRAREAAQYPEREMPEYKLDTSLVARWSEFSAKLGSSLGELTNSSDVAPEIINIKWGNCDEIQYAIICKQIDKESSNSPTKHLWGRMFENTVKIAMIFAIARNKNKPEFEPRDFDLAQMIVESSIEYLEYLAGSHMSETPQEEGNNEVVNFIKASGGKTGRKEIMRKFRKFKKRDLDDILSGLIEQETIEAERVMPDGKGRPTTYYKILKEESLAA